MFLMIDCILIKEYIYIYYYDYSKQRFTQTIKTTTVYDYIILGAGISGIYSTFLLISNSPMQKY